jgi:transketolase
MANTLDQLCVDTLRFLSVDAVQRANSGHPGMPLGAAPMAYALWTQFLKCNPGNPDWADRDRFVLSVGHGSALLYSLLHLSGYDLSLDDIKAFREWGSKAPGHPERGHTPGVEVTTGPLGQGFANAVGMAIGEAQLAARYNRPGHAVIDHHTYVIVGDGDLMEGVAAEATSLAGHLRLGKLVCLYDDNRVTLSAGTDMAFTEDRAARFEACGWHTVAVADGNDVEAIAAALQAARSEASRPSLILVRTHIGYGSPNKHDSFEAHGSPLGVEEVRLTKQRLGWPTEPPFLIPEAVLVHMREALARGQNAEATWSQRMQAYALAFPDLAAELQCSLSGELPSCWDADIPTFPADAKGMATRAASSKVMNAIAVRLPALTGGSADLDTSTKTALKDLGDFNPPSTDTDDTQGSNGGGWSPAGRNLHFGVREHAMGAIVNGLAAGLTVIRPADANETAVAWKLAVESRQRPVLLALTRQEVPSLDRSRYASAEGLRFGAYVLNDVKDRPLEVILIASGSEVALILAAAERLQREGIAVRCVSMPSWDLFDVQPLSYRDDVLPPTVSARLAVELGVTQGWHRYVGDRGDVLGVERFGASAPADVLMREYGFTVDNVVSRARTLLTGMRRVG